MKTLLIVLSSISFIYAQDTVQIVPDTTINGSITNVITSYNADNIIHITKIDYNTKNVMLNIDNYIIPFIQDSTGKLVIGAGLANYNYSDMSTGMKAACDTLCKGFKKILKKAITLKAK